MKRFLLFSLLAIIFTSCSDDLDIGKNPFIGTWQYVQYLVDEEVIPLDDCDDQTIYEVSNDFSITVLTFEEDVEGNCQEADNLSGTWASDRFDLYFLNIDDVRSVQEIIFQSNTFYFEDTFLEAGEIVTERRVFERIN